MFRPAYESLLQYADDVKIDFLITKGDERAEIARNFLRRGIRMLAEKVETYEEFQQGLEAGYELFQGYFFCKPEMVTGRDVSPLKTSLLRLIQEVNRPEVDFDRLESIIKREVALSVKLLRFLHSAGFGWRHDVDTIGQALRVLGEGPTRKWASLVALTLIGDDKPPELVTTSLVRAQFAEQVGLEARMGSRAPDFFLIGMLSTLDTMLGQPMEEALDRMPLPQEVRDTLLGRMTSLSPVWQLVLAYERARWDQPKDFGAVAGVSVGRLPGLYRNAVQWVDRIHRM